MVDGRRPGPPMTMPEAASAAAPAPLPLTSRRTRLRPLGPQFLDELYERAVTGDIPWQWPGAETPEAFRESLWSGVLTQFAIEDRRSGRSVGLISASRANFHHGYCYLSLMLFPEFRMRMWPLEGAWLFGNYLFTRFNLRHIYAETPGPYFAQFRSGEGTLFDVEARFRDRVILNGEPHDLYVLAISRDRWLKRGVALLDRCLTSRGLPPELESPLVTESPESLVVYVEPST
jgi:RimJ/RimL family protein N-acetyltransferase